MGKVIHLEIIYFHTKFLDSKGGIFLNIIIL